MIREPLLDLDNTIGDAPFHELHHRTVGRPIDAVWPACRHVTVGEVRSLRPLLALRSLPSSLAGKGGDGDNLRPDTPLLDTFASSGFVILRCDDEPVDGRASILFGGVGKFWSVAGNEPILVDGPDDLLAFDEPGFARTIARLDAVDLGDGRTRVETETRVAGTDAASTRKFAPYWAIIRLPSGVIRRSWLAAIDRRSARA